MLRKSTRKVKGQVIGKLVPLVLTLLVIAAVSYLVYNIFSPGGQYFDSEATRIAMEKCKFDGQRNDNLLKIALYEGHPDGDLYPDVCDICPIGNSELDSDADGMPDACDSKDKDPSDNSCDKDLKLKLDKKRNRCICKGELTWNGRICGPL